MLKQTRKQKPPIEQLIPYGKENAIKGEEIARFYGAELRTVVKEIQRKRKQGIPILADKNSKTGGYYFDSLDAELEYLARLKRDITALQETYSVMEQHLAGALKKAQLQEQG